MGASMPHPKRAMPRWLKALPLVYLLTGLAWILGSDLVVGWLYRDDLRALVYASSLKGALFVMLTAILLYTLLAMRHAEFESAAYTENPFELRKPLIAFVLVGLGIASASYVVYLIEANGIRARAGEQLKFSTALAADAFTMWHEGQVRSVRQVATSAFTVRAIKEWQSDRSTLLQSMLLERLEALRSGDDHASVTAVDTNGGVLLHAGDYLLLTADLRQSVAAAIATQDVISQWSTIEHPDGAYQPVVDMIVALRNPGDDPKRVVAIIIARTIVRWPLAVRTSNNVAPHTRVTLTRAEGDGVGLMVPASNVALTHEYRTMPRESDRSFAARAVTGDRTAYISRDTKERAVLAVAHPVPGTPWFTVATAELATIEHQIRRLMLLIAGMSALGVLATAALVLPWWRSIRTGTVTLIGQAEARADAMAARLGWVTRHANDAILLIGENARILDANDRAEQFYGYTHEELLSLDVFHLRRADSAQRTTARTQFENVKRGGSLVFETTHVRKDGTSFPVEVSSRQVVLGEQVYIQSIVRDISDRRRVEEELRESEAQYRLMFRSNPHSMWVYDVDTLRFLAVNDAATEQYGYSESEFLARTIADIRPTQDRERLGAHVAAHADDLLQRSGVWQHLRKDGSLVEVEITSHLIEFDGRHARLVLANDVTDRLRSESALRISEERYRSLFENASDGILLIGTNRQVLGANTEYQAMMGYSLEELLAMNLADLLDEREHARLETAADSLRCGLRPALEPWLHRRKDGSRFLGEVRTRHLPEGRLLATVRDLTEIVAARRRIERQRDLYDLLSQCNQAIVRISDRNDLLHCVARLAVEQGRFLFAWIGEINEAAEIVVAATYGDDRGYIATLRFSLDAASPGGTGPTSRAMREGRSVVANDFLNDPKTACWHETARRSGVAASAAFPIFQGGKVTAALMLYAEEANYFDAEICATLEEMTADVSYALDSLRTRRELEDNRLLLDSLINASDALVFAFDLDGRVILINDACARAMGSTPAGLIGQRRDLVMPTETARDHEANDRRVIESGQHLVIEERNVEAGVERVYLSVKYPLRDVDGRMYAVGGIAADITELRRTEQELSDSNRLLEERVVERTREAVEARARAETADRAKTAFLSSMSHELRSPLSSIIGFTSVLLEGMDGELSPIQLEHLRVVSEASYHLLAIINDLLDMSKIEAGAVTPEIMPLSVNRLVDRVVHRFSVLAQQKGLLLSLQRPEGDIRIDGDERRIEQILGNLVSNAIKYTSTGTVTVSIGGGETNQLHLVVSDTGPGIAEEDRGLLFKRFSQLPPARGKLIEGTGLGLAIAAGLAEAMGGEILLQSELGIGSIFTLVLPTNVLEAQL